MRPLRLKYCWKSKESHFDEIINFYEKDIDDDDVYVENNKTLGYTNEIAYIKWLKHKLIEVSNEVELHDVPKSYYYFDKAIDNIIAYLNSLCHIVPSIRVNQITTIVEKYFPLKKGEKEDGE